MFFEVVTVENCMSFALHINLELTTIGGDRSVRYVSIATIP